jgi:hypothetical protein
VGEGRPEFFEKKKVFDTHEILFKKFLPEYIFFGTVESVLDWLLLCLGFKTKLNALKKRKKGNWETEGKKKVEKKKTFIDGLLIYFRVLFNCHSTSQRIGHWKFGQTRGRAREERKKTHTRGTQNPTVKFRENDDDEGKRNKKNRKKKHDKVLKK